MESKWPHFLAQSRPTPTEEHPCEPAPTAGINLVDLTSDPLEWDAEDRAVWEELEREFDSRC